MPVPAIITIANETPTNMDFRPVRIGEMSTLIGTSVTNAGNPQVILGYSFASVNRKTDRIPVRFNLPREVTDVDTGTTSVADTARFVGEFIIPDTWTETERGHFHAYVDNLIGHATVKGYVKSRDPFYG
jgi:hypothetical protein